MRHDPAQVLCALASSLNFYANVSNRSLLWAPRSLSFFAPATIVPTTSFRAIAPRFCESSMKVRSDGRSAGTRCIAHPQAPGFTPVERAPKMNNRRGGPAKAADPSPPSPSQKASSEEQNITSALPAGRNASADGILTPNLNSWPRPYFRLSPDAAAFLSVDWPRWQYRPRAPIPSNASSAARRGACLKSVDTNGGRLPSVASLITARVSK